jgi:hypothetical protein
MTKVLKRKWSSSELWEFAVDTRRDTAKYGASEQARQALPQPGSGPSAKTGACFRFCSMRHSSCSLWEHIQNIDKLTA